MELEELQGNLEFLHTMKYCPLSIVHSQLEQGFTLIEMVVVLGVLGTLLAFSTTNLLGLNRRTRMSTTLRTLVADLQMQRLRAMGGDTGVSGTLDSYGVYFAGGTYTLFHGATYSASATDNIVIPFDEPITVQGTAFANSQIVFTRGSGEIASFVDGQNTVTLVNAGDNATAEITLNRYGTIIAGTP